MSKNNISPPEIERRYLAARLTTRGGDVKGDGKKLTIAGVAAVFDQEAIIGGVFREVLRKGAFTKILARRPDIIGAYNHDWAKVLGRTVAGTLRLEQLADGLHYEIDINPRDQEAMSVYAKVQRGDIRQSSYAFNVKPEDEVWIQPADNNLLPLREIKHISELFDVSPVTFPAYSETTANVRSRLEAVKQGQVNSPRDPRGKNDLKRRRIKLAELE